MDEDEIKLAKAAVDAAFSDHIQRLYIVYNTDYNKHSDDPLLAMGRGLTRALVIRRCMLADIDSREKTT